MWVLQAELLDPLLRDVYVHVSSGCASPKAAHPGLHIEEKSRADLVVQVLSSLQQEQRICLVGTKLSKISERCTVARGPDAD